jgi:hypothetical protein
MDIRLRLGSGLAALCAGLALAGAAAAQQTYDGDWEGVLQAGPQKFHVELLVKTDAKQMGAVFKVVEQNATIPATAVKVENGELGVLLMNMNAEITGKMSADGKSINGAFWQGQSLPLVLTRKAAATPAKAP